MSVLVVLIGISLLLALSFLFIFFRAVNKGQFDDDYTPSVRILFDKPPTQAKEAQVKEEEKKEE
ncbi:cbb3-type cytochrome oxidase assembly protein CcoS [Cytophagales bacterium LB-30]|uniref:Cbb3-type cytochrome oxidase assembly protein CcoS n=1 Tax=Shiella aurantiaca TaxID=3058365 RepID=A0ABT8F2F5_9BACT|nr:cbb3-type cytochrome oxidase assembly protein CcoS [Shiella aurantiaca]MDN4164558.1 cbb3-type cytochrome oxidase assembly protein CcoS [Shiella aurantiaca]